MTRKMIWHWPVRSTTNAGGTTYHDTACGMLHKHDHEILIAYAGEPTCSRCLRSIAKRAESFARQLTGWVML